MRIESKVGGEPQPPIMGEYFPGSNLNWDVKVDKFKGRNNLSKYSNNVQAHIILVSVFSGPTYEIYQFTLRIKLETFSCDCYVSLDFKFTMSL